MYPLSPKPVKSTIELCKLLDFRKKYAIVLYFDVILLSHVNVKCWPTQK